MEFPSSCSWILTHFIMMIRNEKAPWDQYDLILETRLFYLLTLNDQDPIINETCVNQTKVRLRAGDIQKTQHILLQTQKDLTGLETQTGRAVLRTGGQCDCSWLMGNVQQGIWVNSEQCDESLTQYFPFRLKLLMLLEPVLTYQQYCHTYNLILTPTNSYCLKSKRGSFQWPEPN